MICYEDECVTCPVEMGCIGERCPNRNVKHMYCDKCLTSVDKLYIYNDEQLCEDCLLESLQKVEL